MIDGADFTNGSLILILTPNPNSIKTAKPIEDEIVKKSIL